MTDYTQAINVAKTRTPVEQGIINAAKGERQENSSIFGKSDDYKQKTTLEKLDNIYKMGSTGGIIHTPKPHVVIDGETYYVKNVEEHNPLKLTILPHKKQVVEIDGKQYDVQTVPNPVACDATKQVVVIDGKQYDVHDPTVHYGG